MQTAINANIAALAAGNYLDAVAFAAFIESEGINDLDEALEAFQDAYAGTYENLKK